MPGLPHARAGQLVLVKQRTVPFSFWPMYRGTRRPGLQSHVFSTNPWSLIRGHVQAECPAAAQAEALATLVQAEAFFDAAESASVWASKPLLTYYGLLNLTKTLGLTRRLRTTYDRAQHGLSEKLTAGGPEITGAYLEAYPSPNRHGVPQVFADLVELLGGSPPAALVRYDLPHLLPQLVAGHRLWVDAAGEPKERFVAIKGVEMVESGTEVWLRVRIAKEDLTRLSYTQGEVVSRALGTGVWRQVKHGDAGTVLRYEQVAPTTFTGRAADKLNDLAATGRTALWTTVTSAAPYRRYYVYLAPASEQAAVLPQVAAAYAVFYYLGSVTRYRPQQFDVILGGQYGSFVEEVLTSQPRQLVYLLASEFAGREVTQAALV